MRRCINGGGSTTSKRLAVPGAVTWIPPGEEAQLVDLAAAFALKVLDYEAFKALCSSIMTVDEIPRGAAPDEGDGSLRRRPSAGSGLTALHQEDQLLVHDEVATRGDGGYPITPGIRGLSFMESLKTSLPILYVKIC